MACTVEKRMEALERELSSGGFEALTVDELEIIISDMIDTTEGETPTPPKSTKSSNVVTYAQYEEFTSSKEVKDLQNSMIGTETFFKTASAKYGENYKDTISGINPEGIFINSYGDILDNQAASIEDYRSNYSKLFNKFLDVRGLKEETLEFSSPNASINPDKSKGDTSETYEISQNEDITDTYMQLVDADKDANVIQFLDKDFGKHLTDTLNAMEKFYKDNYADKQIDLIMIDVDETSTDNSRQTAGQYSLKYDYKTKRDIESITVFHNPNNSSASIAEVFLHENVHALFKRALKLKPSLATQMLKLRKKALSSGVDYSIFLQQNQLSSRAKGEESYTASALDIKLAKEKFDYVFNESADIEEFMAYAISNTYVFKHLKDLDIKLTIPDSPDSSKGVVGLMDFFKSLMSYMFDMISSSRKPTKGVDVITDTMADIIKFQTKLKIESNDNSYSSAFSTDFVNSISPSLDKGFSTAGAVLDYMAEKSIPINEKLKNLITKFFKLRDKALKTNGVKRISYVLKAMSELPVIKQTTQSQWMKGILQQVFMDTADGEFAPFFTKFRHAKKDINKLVNDMKTELNSMINDKSIMSLQNVDKEELASSVLFKKGIAPILDKIIKDKLFTHEAIGESLQEIDTKLSERLNTAQKGHLNALAEFINDGKAHIKNQQINVDNIVNNVFLPSINRPPSKLTFKEHKALVEDMEDYLNLKVLELQSEEVLSSIEALTEDSEVVKEVGEISSVYEASYVKGHLNQYRNESNFTAINELPSNYIQPSNDTPFTIQFVTEEELGLMDSLNVTVINKDKPLILGDTKYYKAKVSVTETPFSEGIISLTSYKDRGLSISNIMRSDILLNNPKVSVKELDEKLKQFIKAIEKPESGFMLEAFDANGFMPQYNEQGVLVDYFVPVSHIDSKTIEEADWSLSSMVSHSVSRLNNIEISKKNNKKIVNDLISFYAYNKGDKSTEFIHVSADSNSVEGIKRWDSLPNYLKTYIKEVTGITGLHIPKEIDILINGVKQSTTSNFIKTKKGRLSNTKTQIVKLSEKLLGELLGFSKQILTLYNANIIIANTMSNMHLAFINGISPIAYYKEFTRGWRLLTDYEKLSIQLTKAQLSKSTGSNNQHIIDSIKNQMSSSEFTDIVADGQFTPLIDDLDTDSKTYIGGKLNNLFKLNEKEINKEAVVKAKRVFATNENTKSLTSLVKNFKKEIKKKQKPKLPVSANTVRKLLFGLKGTSANRLATKFTMYGDTLTRNMIYKKRERTIEDKNNRPTTQAEKQLLLNEMDKLLINYSYPTSGLQMWSEKVGGIQFQKYFLQAGKSYAGLIKHNPLGVVASQTEQAFLFDTPDPTDTYANGITQAVVNRSVLLDPIDLVTDIVTPNIFMPFDVNVNSLYK